MSPVRPAILRWSPDAPGGSGDHLLSEQVAAGRPHHGLQQVLTPHLFFASVVPSTYRTHERETTMTTMFVNLPVTDLERAKAFYTAIGFTINPLFTDHNAACVVVEEDHSYFMILTRDFFQTFTDRPIGDPAVNVVGGDRDLPRQPGGGRQGRRRRPRRRRLGGAPRIGLRLHVPAPAHRPRRQHHRVRLDGPGRRRAGPRGVR